MNERSDPNSRWEIARTEWERGVTRETARAKVAKVALGVTIALHAALVVASTLANEATFALLTLADIALLVLTAVVFLRWLACAVSLASSMSALRLRWTSSAAVWAFFMPIVGLWRPYQVLRDLHDLLSPAGVPEPAPKPVLDGSGGYRDVPMKAAPPPQAIPHAWIGAWWGLFMGTRLIAYNNHAQNQANVVGQVLAVASATLGMLVVRAIDARIHERWRRLRHASDEELAAWDLRV